MRASDEMGAISWLGHRCDDFLVPSVRVTLLQTLPCLHKMSHIYEQSNQLSQPKKKDRTCLHQYRGFPISMIKVNSNISVTGYLIKTQKKKENTEKIPQTQTGTQEKEKEKGKEEINGTTRTLGARTERIGDFCVRKHYWTSSYGSSKIPTWSR